MGGRDIDVAQPTADHGEFYSGLEQMHRCRVPEGMGSHNFFREFWTGFDSIFDALINDIPYPKSTNRISAKVATRK